MQVTWFVEKDVWQDDEEERLLKALEQTKTRVKLFDLQDTYHSVDNEQDGQGPVIGRGSIQFIKRHMNSCFPWAYVSWPDFRCSNYYPNFSDLLLSKKFFFLPWGLIRGSKKFLYEQLGGKNNSIFIRPDTNDKIFSGRVVKESDFDKWFEQENSCYDPDNALQCIVAQTEEIIEERRCICCVEKCQFVSSAYGKKTSDADLTVDNSIVYEILTRIKENPLIFGPDIPFIVVDLARTKDGWFLLEFGSVNCCAWYNCDPVPIIEEINDYERRHWSVE